MRGFFYGGRGFFAVSISAGLATFARCIFFTLNSLSDAFFHLKSTKYSLSIRHAFHRAIRRAFLRALRRIFTEIVDNAVRCVACFRGLGCFTGFVFKGCVVRLYTHIYTYIHIYIQKCIHTYKQTYIHTYTHTYIHTYIQICMHACIHTCTWPPCM